MTNLTRSNFQPHPFHLVSPSPWPLYCCISLLALTTSGVLTTMLTYLSHSKVLIKNILCIKIFELPKPHPLASLPLQSDYDFMHLAPLFSNAIQVVGTYIAESEKLRGMGDELREHGATFIVAIDGLDIGPYPVSLAQSALIWAYMAQQSAVLGNLRRAALALHSVESTLNQGETTTTGLIVKRHYAELVQAFANERTNQTYAVLSDGDIGLPTIEPDLFL